MAGKDLLPLFLRLFDNPNECPQVVLLQPVYADIAENRIALRHMRGCISK